MPFPRLPVLGQPGISLGSMSEDRVPVEQVMTGMTLHALPDDWTPIEALVVMKCLDEKGHSSWVYRTTAVPNREELLGALVVHVSLLRRELVSEWEGDEER